MHTRLTSKLRLGLFGLLLGATTLLTGCNTPEPDNQSTRPWNAPKGWEGGVPGMIYDRR